MKHKHSLLQRALSIVLSFAVVLPASLALIGDSGSAQAAGTKASISVLSIESTAEHNLTTTMVAGWTGYADNTTAIKITYMSTSEFIGSIKDLEENYDLIYVGDCVSASGSFSNELPENYIYANIGAEHDIRDDAIGLTDAEYLSNTFFSSADSKTYYKLSAAQNTRYSGNDLTPIALEKLNDYAAAGHPVIFASGLINGYPGSTPATFTAVITSSKSYINAILTATPTKTSGVSLPGFNPTYQWYNTSSGLITGAVSSTYTATVTGAYYCKITYTIGSNISTATSKSYNVTIKQPVVTYSGTASVGSATFYYYGNRTYKYNVAIGYSAGKLTVTPSKNTGSTLGDSADYTYQWYNSSNVALTGVNTDATYTVAETIGTSYYYCYVGATNVIYYGTSYNVLANTRGKTKTAKVVITGAVVAVVSGSTGTAGTISTLMANPFTVDESYVDNCSNIYTFMHTFFNGGTNAYANVMSSAYIYKSTLLGYINLSDPEINLTDKPTVYSINDSGVMTSLAKDSGSNPATYTLKYNFTITNATETDSTTKYNCNLYIDSDANGKYGTEEGVSGIEIKQASDSAVVTSGNLVVDTPYVVTYRLPVGKVGIIPWKLEIVKVGTAGVSASVSDYTRVEGTAPQTINILQINTGRNSSQTYGSTGNGYNLSWTYEGFPLDTTTGSVPASITGNRDYNTEYYLSQSWTKLYNLFTKISSDYDINIQTVTTTAVNSISTTSIENRLLKNTSGGYDSYANIDSFLDSYDMVLIGIDNNYNELSKETAEALAGYLENNPILYTHNPSSFNNVPQAYASAYNTNFYVENASYFGYYFNMVLRNPLGLDRYGVADNEYGHTKMSNPSLLKSGIVASNDYTGMNDTQKSALLDAGYSIAYEPGSNTAGTGGTPIVTTQGFSNYYGNEYYPIATQASQVNQGQITSYPFDINTTDFESGSTLGAYVPLATTHPLFYQLNMNSDNVVVWYCLNNNELDYNRYEPNDVTNAYYLYRSGNATYSGFGQDTFSLGDAEAKLFVNTIIAASHASGSSRVAPTVALTDSTGSKTLNTFMLPSDSSGVLTPAAPSAKDKSRRVYFTVTDNSVGTKTISASLIYGTVPTTINLIVYDASNDTVATDWVSGALYYFKIDTPTSNATTNTALLSYISQNIASGITLDIEATTTIGGVPLSGTDSLTLRSFALFNLS